VLRDAQHRVVEHEGAASSVHGGLQLDPYPAAAAVEISGNSNIPAFRHCIGAAAAAGSTFSDSAAAAGPACGVLQAA